MATKTIELKKGKYLVREFNKGFVFLRVDRNKDSSKNLWSVCELNKDVIIKVETK